MQPFVSVLTPTYNRRKFIPAAITMFKAQTYPQTRMEWLILDDGTDRVADLFAASGLTNVRYIELPEGTKMPIGGKRNRLNEEAKGDIIVCWDDDDYYPPERVRKAVTKLCSVPKHSIPFIGASQILLYFTDRDEIWTIGPYSKYHCTNGTMAYWRSYFGEHRYDDDAEKAEEKKFMCNYETPVIQMKPEDVMLVICHAHNTFDKRTLFGRNNPFFKKSAFKLSQIVKDKSVRDFYLALKADYEQPSAAHLS